MPTIPRFHVTQDAAWLFVHVHVPYVRVSEMEFYVDGTHFTFFCKPYLLKLQFPHEVVDDELAKAVYDPNKENGTIVVHLPKKEPGQDFEDLDMLTKLLQPKAPPIDLALQKTKTAAPLIEVLASTDTSDNSDAPPAIATATPAAATMGSTHTASASLLDLEARLTDDAEPATTPPIRITDRVPSYGFNGAYSDFFRVWHGDVSEIVSLPDPDETPADRRATLREAAEDAAFDVERYLLDFLHQTDDPYVQLALDYTPFWHAFPVVTVASTQPTSRLVLDVSTQLDALALSTSSDAPSTISGQPSQTQTQTLRVDIFSDADRKLLLRLPHKEFLVERGSADEAALLVGLADILVGYTYDHITTQGDSTIESTWTASIISPTLAWLDVPQDVAALVRTAVRRILTFPFLRQFDVAVHVVREAAALLVRGKRVVLQALLALYRIVEKSETQYLLNALYVSDYCVWIQSVDDAALVELGKELERHAAAFRKADTGWALDDMERKVLEDGDDEEIASDDADESSSDDDSSSSSSSSDDSDDDDGDAMSSDDEHDGATEHRA